MEDGNWFDDWIKKAQEKIEEWREQAEAFSHRGVRVAPSGKWLRWVTLFTPTSCEFCKDANGKIIDPENYFDSLPVYFGTPAEPPVHPNCRCAILPLPAIKAGTATIRGQEGADWFLTFFGELPGYYITKEEAEAKGWKSKKGNLDKAAPGMMIDGGIYWNGKGKLPEAPGRVWYEADINYTHGYRGDHRILYSNDGLIFVTYDHYETFFEITP